MTQPQASRFHLGPQEVAARDVEPGPSDLPFTPSEDPANLGAPAPRKCRRHEWYDSRLMAGTVYEGITTLCRICGKPKDEARSRRGRTNRNRGNRAELDVARAVGGEKVGPLGHPWDVTMPGYARLQVKKWARPPSLRVVARLLAEIARAPGDEMPGVVWIEPGRGGERLIIFRAKDFAERHGTPQEGTP